MVCAETFHVSDLEEDTDDGSDGMTRKDWGVTLTMVTKRNGWWLEVRDDMERVQVIHRNCP